MKSNYDISRDNASITFLKYNQQKMTAKFDLENDENYIYINFVSRKYAVNRIDGKVYIYDGKDNNIQANHDATFSIYDVLCNSHDNCHTLGTYAVVTALKGLNVASSPGGSLYTRYAQKIEGNEDVFIKYCESIGGERIDGGDISYKIPVFDFVDCIIRFWNSDEDFDADVQFLFDENMLMYLKFETVFYVMSHILKEILSFIDNNIS